PAPPRNRQSPPRRNELRRSRPQIRRQPAHDLRHRQPIPPPPPTPRPTPRRPQRRHRPRPPIHLATNRLGPPGRRNRPFLRRQPRTRPTSPQATRQTPIQIPQMDGPPPEGLTSISTGNERLQN